MSGAGLGFLSIHDASQQIAAGRLSPVELVEALIARAEGLDGTLHAYLLPTFEPALAAARRAEAEIAAGRRLGALHGIPYGLKDIIDTAGIRTTCHSKILEHNVPARDAVVTERLNAAGAILMGKLATHEFAFGGPCFDLPWPPARNPWRLDRFPGGSSSGAGAAVAAGLAPGALGSDTGGSIRLPAGFCGLAGIKPTYGRVSRRGVLPLSWTLDNCGPLAWTVEDAAILLQVIAGHDPMDPATSRRPVPDYRATLEVGIRGVRLGWVRHLYERDCPASDEAVAAMESAAGVLRGLGAQVREITLPHLEDYQACYRGIMLSEAFAIHAADLRAHPERFSAVTRFRVLPGALLGAADYANALRFQRVLVARTLEAMEGVDALITATIYGPAPVQAAMRPEDSFLRPPLTNPFNVAQLPAISVCNGFSGEGLPLGMQVVGRPFDEAGVLRVARAYERETPWRERRPQLIGPVPDASPVVPPVPGDDADPSLLDRCRALAKQAGLELDEEQLAGLCAAWPHVRRMLERIPAGRDYAGAPATLFRHA